MSFDIRLDDVQRARQRIADYVRHTPLLPLPSRQHDLSSRLRLKLENLQITGSFKVRGAFNTLLQIAPDRSVKGVVTASGGNHGVALAYAAQRLGLPATIFLPETASADRVARIATLGATVFQRGKVWDEANIQALEYAADGLLYVHPFDAVGTIEGQATLGLELLDDIPDLDCVLVAIGGGGLIGGVAAALKQTRPDIHVIGIEPTGASSMLRSVEAGHVVTLPEVRTIADTLAPRAIADRTLALTQRYVDDIVLVDDGEMIAAMRWLWAECNQLVEPAGAVVLAAALTGKIDLERYRAPAAIICGGNAAAESVFLSYAQTATLLA